jgi:hypothetical protein
MMVKNAKTGESRRRCQVTLLYAGSNLNTEKEIKTDAIKALASVDTNYEENVMEDKVLPSKKVIIPPKDEEAQRDYCTKNWDSLAPGAKIASARLLPRAFIYKVPFSTSDDEIMNETGATSVRRTARPPEKDTIGNHVPSS